jgi:hypothetical protein
VTGRRSRKCKQILVDLKKKRGYWKLKEETVDRTPWRPRLREDNESLVKQKTE